MQFHILRVASKYIDLFEVHRQHSNCSAALCFSMNDRTDTRSGCRSRAKITRRIVDGVAQPWCPFTYNSCTRVSSLLRTTPVLEFHHRLMTQYIRYIGQQRNNKLPCFYEQAAIPLARISGPTWRKSGNVAVSQTDAVRDPGMRVCRPRIRA